MAQPYREKKAFLLAAILVFIAGAYLTGTILFQAEQGKIEINQKLNPNTADEAALMLLEGIGPTKAKAIVNFRNESKSKTVFSDCNDLQKISGIGPKTVEKLKPFLEFE